MIEHRSNETMIAQKADNVKISHKADECHGAQREIMTVLKASEAVKVAGQARWYGEGKSVNIIGNTSESHKAVTVHSAGETVTVY